MKKLNVICASIAALFAVNGAIAGVATSTPNLVAVENFGGSTSLATDTVAAGPINFSLTSIAAINDQALVYFTVRLVGGTFAVVPGFAQFTFAGQTCAAVRNAGIAPGCVVTRSTDRSTVLVTVTAAASATLGLGAFGYVPAAGDIDGANTTLAQTGTSVTASIGILTLAPGSIESSTAQATIDAPIATAAVITSARAITPSVTASSFTGQINLLASPPGSNFTTPGYAILGQFSFTNPNTGTASAPNIRTSLVTDYLLNAGSSGADNTGVTVLVAPGSNQSFPIGSRLSLSDSSTCASVFGGAQSAVLTGTTATAPVTLTATAPVVSTVFVPGAPPTAPVGTPYFVCVSAPSTGNTASPIQATITATVAPGVSKDLIAFASGLGYNLGFNGSTVDIATYWPGVLESQNTGYAGYIRLTNTGSVAAPVTAQHLSPATGMLTGTAAAVNVPVVLPNGVLASGQSVLLSTRQIDAAIGAAPSGFTSGRIRFTAPTNGLRVQSLLQNVAGNATPVEYKNPASECRTTGGGGTVPAVVGGVAPAGTIASVSTTCTPSSN